MPAINKKIKKKSKERFRFWFRGKGKPVPEDLEKFTVLKDKKKMTHTSQTKSLN